jgi:hypothetical protein
LSSGKSKKNAIFFKKTCFLGKYGAFSTVFRVVKHDVPGMEPGVIRGI